MRAFILAHGLRVAGGRNVGQNLLPALARAAPEHQYTVTIPAHCGYESVCEGLPNLTTVSYDHTKGAWHRLVFEKRRLPRLVAAYRPDVVLGLGNFGLLDPPCPQAVLVHEAHFFYPSRYIGTMGLKARVKLSVMKHRFAGQLAGTALVFCQTGVIERRLRQQYGYDGKTCVLPNAVSQFPESGDSRVPEPLVALEGRMKLFCLTRYYAHKNLEILIDTFDRFRDDLEGVVVITTVAAEQHPRAPGFLRAIRRKGLEGRIVNVGPLDKASLPGYYRHTDALLLPTLLESFSGTYVEAMQFETPIITSDLDFAREVCGEAAEYFDPWSAASLKEAILRVRSNPQRRRERVTYGQTRLQEFGSWNANARMVDEQLNQLARGQGR